MQRSSIDFALLVDISVDCFDLDQQKMCLKYIIMILFFMLKMRFF